MQGPPALLLLMSVGQMGQEGRGEGGLAVAGPLQAGGIKTWV